MSSNSRRIEKHLLPSTTDGICALLRDVLSQGRVQRIELDVDDTFVRVVREVEDHELAEDEVSWDGALRNVSTMVEYNNENSSWAYTIADMFLLCQQDRLRAIAWVIGAGEDNLLRRWLEIDRRNLPITSPIRELYGLPVYTVRSLPEETLILCCSKYAGAEPSEITLAIKTAMEVRDAAHHEVTYRGGTDPKECADSDVVLALSPRGLRSVAWEEKGKP